MLDDIKEGWAVVANCSHINLLVMGSNPRNNLYKNKNRGKAEYIFHDGGAL